MGEGEGEGERDVRKGVWERERTSFFYISSSPFFASPTLTLSPFTRN